VLPKIPPPSGTRAQPSEETPRILSEGVPVFPHCNGYVGVEDGGAGNENSGARVKLEDKAQKMR